MPIQFINNVMGKLIFLIIVIIGGVFLFSFLSSANMGEDKWMRITYLIVLLSFLSSGLLHSYSGKAKQALRDITIWLGVFVVLLIGYSFRGELGFVKERVVGELFPYNPTEDAGELVYRRADDGHFYIEAEVNNVSVRFLVDTGATRVALSMADAERVGFQPENMKFNSKSGTANGIVWGAPVNLRTVRIGSYEIKSVAAYINSGDMDISLLGMTFLDRLNGYNVSGDTLTLRP